MSLLLPLLAQAQNGNPVVWPQPESYYSGKAASVSRRTVEQAPAISAQPTTYANATQLVPQQPTMPVIAPQPMVSYPPAPMGYAGPAMMPSMPYAMPMQSMPSMPNFSMPSVSMPTMSMPSIPFSSVPSMGSLPFGAGNIMPFPMGNGFSGMPFGFGN